MSKQDDIQMYAGMVASIYTYGTCMYTYTKCQTTRNSKGNTTCLPTCIRVHTLLTWAKRTLQLHTAPGYPLLLTEHHLHEGGPQIPAELNTAYYLAMLFTGQ